MVPLELETEDSDLEEEWLARLPAEDQETLRRRWNARAEQAARAARRERRRALLDWALVIAAFGLGDLLRGWTGPVPWAIALGVGSFVGGLILVLEADRRFAALLGGAALLFEQWLARGGLDARGLATLVPLVTIFWIVGRHREVV